MTLEAETPVIPVELWMLQMPADAAADLPACWMAAEDPTTASETYLTFLSKDDAEAEAAHQLAEYGEECVPVRVK